jgi:hypothetical protein
MKLFERIQATLNHLVELYSLAPRVTELRNRTITMHAAFCEFKEKFDEFETLLAAAENELRTRAASFERGNVVLSDQIAELIMRQHKLEEKVDQWKHNHSEKPQKKGTECAPTTATRKNQGASAQPLKINGRGRSTGARSLSPGRSSKK